MRWLSYVPLLAAIGAGSPLLTGATPRPGELPHYLLTDREAFVLCDAEMVALAPVKAAVWSPDGHYVLAARQEKLSSPPSEQMASGALSLIVWNRATSHSRVIWQRPAGPLQMIGQLEWLPSTHAALMVLNWLPPPPGSGRAVAKWQAVDLRTGAVSALASAPERFQEKPLPVRLRSTVTALKEENTTQRVRPLWLESVVKSDQPRMLVCADSEGGSLAPDAGAVLYFTQGALWATPLTRMPREQMLAQIRAAQREVAISNARQIGLALSMYAQDYDETFPLADGSAGNALQPYLKSDSTEMLSPPGAGSPGFVYVYNGGPMNTIKDPMTTILGYSTGPGGRAMIFADGHVEWRNDAENSADPAGALHRRAYFR